MFMSRDCFRKAAHNPVEEIVAVWNGGKFNFDDMRIVP
jgi:hypothetical protein